MGITSDVLGIDRAAVDVAIGDVVMYRLVCGLGATAGIGMIELGVATKTIAELDGIVEVLAEVCGV